MDGLLGRIRVPRLAGASLLFRLGLGAVLAATLILCALAPTAHAAGWLPAFDLTGTNVNAVRMSADGDIAILLHDGADASLRFRPAGGPLGPAEDPFPAGAQDERLDMDAAGNTYLAWDRAGATEARVREQDGTLGPVETIAAATAPGPEISVSADGVATIAWLTDLTGRTIAARTRAADGTLGSLQTVTAGGEKTRDFDLDVAGDGDATFVWTTPEAPPNTKVKARTLDFAGQTLSAIRDVSLPPSPELSDMAEVAVDPAGNATLVWRHLTAAFNALTETRSLSAAGVLSATQILTASGFGSQGHSVAVDNSGNARIAWTEHATGSSDPFIPQTCIRAATSTCGALTQVANSQALQTTVAMGGDGDAIIGLGDGRARVFPRSGGPLAIQPLSATPALPFAALDDAGDGITVWTEGSVPRAAGYDAVAPRIDSVSVPATGERGVPIPISASIFDVWGAQATWDFGDGGTAQGEAVKHRFQKTGTFEIQVTATDGAGASASATRQIAIKDTKPPKLKLSGPGKRALKRKVPVRARCADERCSLLANGKLVVGKGKHRKSFRLRKAATTSAAGARTTLKPHLSGRGMKAAKRSLRKGGKAKTRIKVVARDAAGNAASKRRTVKLKLKR